MKNKKDVIKLMIASSYQVNEPVAEESGEKAEDNAEGDIEPEHEEVSGLEH